MNSIDVRQKLPALVSLTRLDRPIGIYLLMWPMLWAFWFAAEGIPTLSTLLIFVAGTALTRSAGCAINDYADRDFDGQVTRTRNRPLATGALQPKDALVTTAALMLLAFALVLMTNALTIKLSFVALLLAIVYPFTKRHTHYPQLVLGAAFACAVPMAFTAQINQLPTAAWILFIAAVVWAMAYDTLYAIADRADDLKIGIKSTAILFGRFDLLMVGLFQLIMLSLLVYVGILYERGMIFYLGLASAAGFAAYQLWLCRDREPHLCVKAFLNNNWLGMTVFVALVLDYLIKP